MKLVEDLLDVMLSYSGEYIRKNQQGAFAL
jgi:hypothetical protein